VKTPNAAPRHLSAESRRLWSRLNAEFHLSNGAATALLRVLCESLDRMEGAPKAA